MRQVTPSEILALREMLQMESNALAKARIVQNTITDDQLKSQAQAGVLAAEGRIRGLQQFISENNVITMREVQ